MSELTFRRLGIEDYEALLSLLNRAFGEDFSWNFPRLFSEPNEYVTSAHIGAFLDGRLAGTAAAYPLTYVADGTDVELVANGNVAVDPDVRNLGIMSKVLDKVEELTGKDGDLHYLHGNRIRYRRFGYELAGTEYLMKFVKKSFSPGLAEGLVVEKMKPEDASSCLALARKRGQYLVRRPEELIPALTSFGREALTVKRDGRIIAYFSFGRQWGKVEEAAFEGEEMPALAALWNDAGDFTLRMGEYEPERLRKLLPLCFSYSMNPPANFKIVNWKKLLSLGIRMAKPAPFSLAVEGEDFGRLLLTEKGAEETAAEPELHLAGWEQYRILFGSGRVHTGIPAADAVLPLPIFAPFLT